MTTPTQDLVITTATIAAHNACAEVIRAKGFSPNDAPYWHDAPEALQLKEIECAKSLLGLPNTLTEDDVVNVFDVALFINVVKSIPQSFNCGVFIVLPTLTPIDLPVDVAGEQAAEGSQAVVVQLQPEPVTSEALTTAVEAPKADGVTSVDLPVPAFLGDAPDVELHDDNSVTLSPVAVERLQISSGEQAVLDDLAKADADAALLKPLELTPEAKAAIDGVVAAREEVAKAFSATPQEPSNDNGGQPAGTNGQ